MAHKLRYNEFKQLIVNGFEPRDVEAARELLEDYDGYHRSPIVCEKEEMNECECGEYIEDGRDCILYDIIFPECEFKKEIEKIKRLRVLEKYQLDYDITEFDTEESLIFNFYSKAKINKKPTETVWKDEEFGKHKAVEYYYNQFFLEESKIEPGTMSFFLSVGGSYGIECPFFIDPEEKRQTWLIPKAMGLHSKSSAEDLPMEMVIFKGEDKLLAVSYRQKRKRHWIQKTVMQKLIKE